MALSISLILNRISPKSARQKLAWIAHTLQKSATGNTKASLEMESAGRKKFRKARRRLTEPGRMENSKHQLEHRRGNSTAN